MYLLELFSGTKSVSKAVSEVYTCFSLDISSQNDPDIVVDVLNWDYKQFSPGYFDVIWASPPCTEYSIAKNAWENRGHPRKLDLADSIVKKTLDIIDYLKPRLWFIENPRTGLLKSRYFMKDLPFYDVTYCRYGFPFKKETRIWSNLTGFKPLFCCRENHCSNSSISHRNALKHESKVADSKLNVRMSIPLKLIKSLIFS